MEASETVYEDGESYNYGKSDSLSFRDIVLMNLKRIGDINGLFKGGMDVERYIRCVQFLDDALCPYYDSEMLKAVGAYEKELSDLPELVLGKKFPTHLDERVFVNQERFKAHRRLFRGLCRFLFRRKYLDVGSLED